MSGRRRTFASSSWRSVWHNGPLAHHEAVGLMTAGPQSSPEGRKSEKVRNPLSGRADRIRLVDQTDQTSEGTCLRGVMCKVLRVVTHRKSFRDV